MDGLAVGSSCFRDPAEAAAALCSSVVGVSAAGVVSCEAPSTASGVTSYVLVTQTSAGRTSATATAVLQPCDPVDLEEWGPVLAEWSLALLSVLLVRLLYTRIFKGEY